MVKQADDRKTTDMFDDEQKYIIKRGVELYIKQLSRQVRSAQTPVIAKELEREILKSQQIVAGIIK